MAASFCVTLCFLLLGKRLGDLQKEGKKAQRLYLQFPLLLTQRTRVNGCISPGHNMQPAIQDNGRVSAGDAYRLACSYYDDYFFFVPRQGADAAGGGVSSVRLVVVRGDAHQAAGQKHEGEGMNNPSKNFLIQMTAAGGAEQRATRRRVG